VTHVVLDAPAAAGGTARVIARPDGDACAVEVAAGEGAGALPARPLIATLDAACAVALDAERPPDVAWPGDTAEPGATAGLGADHAAPPASHLPYRPSPRPARGCCGAQAAPDPTMALLPAVLAALLLRRRRRPC
jgi:MYXO-CTERM domain-containing protein